jgi:DNA repair exonuclease SbcCD nuclease subunit
MKHLITSDFHLGINIDNYVTKGKTNSRFEEQKGVIGEIWAYAVTNKIEHIIIKGDVFHYNRPMPIYLAFMIAQLKMSEKLKIKVDIIGGNHDFNQSSVSALEPLKKAFKDSEYIRIIDNEVISDGKFLYVPFGIPVNKIGNNDYLVCHAHIKGAVAGSESFMMAGGEDFIDKIPKSTKCVFSGHIHKPQKFYVNKIPIYHAGSITRIDTGEREDAKSFIVFDDENDSVHTVKIESAVEYMQIEIDDDKIDNEVSGLHKWAVDGKIVKVIVNKYKGINSLEQIEQKLSDALLIKSISFNRAKVNRKDMDKGMIGLSPSEALKRHFDKHENKKVLVEEGNKILQECING